MFIQNFIQLSRIEQGMEQRKRSEMQNCLLEPLMRASAWMGGKENAGFGSSWYKMSGYVILWENGRFSNCFNVMGKLYSVMKIEETAVVDIVVLAGIYEYYLSWGLTIIFGKRLMKLKASRTKRYRLSAFCAPSF